MGAPTTRRVAWTLAGMSTALLVGNVTLLNVDRKPTLPAGAVDSQLDDVSLAIMALAVVALGVILASRRPHNPIGWLALASVLSLSLAQFGLAYATRALVVAPGSLPFGRQNVAKYARATAALIGLREEDGDLVFEVTDDGVGFDPAAAGAGTGLQGMRDRLGAMGGRLSVRSAPGEGTSISGRLPTGATGTARNS